MAAKPPPKPPKEKAVKPKKEVVKPEKPVKPDPTVKPKVVGHQPGVVRGITYYKASKADKDEHEGGESFFLFFFIYSLSSFPEQECIIRRP